MVFVIALLLAALFSLCCSNILKKHAGTFYAAAVLVSAVSAVCTYAGLAGGFPAWFSAWIWPLAARGALGTALFVMVMFAGAVPDGSSVMRKLMPVRGELSIIACILTLGHNITYGKTYFVMLFTRPSVLSPAQMAACITSIVMISIMLPLFITSFKGVRRRMRAKTWKRLQRAAYVFYALIYTHVMLLSVPMYMRGMNAYLVNMIVYTAVFGIYAAMRIQKAAKKNKKRKAKRTAASDHCLT